MIFPTEDNITELAAKRWATAHDPRMAKIMASAVRHLHSFIREVELTHDEWFQATEWLSRAGQWSDEKRKEFILASDVLGASMLVVMINGRTPDGATPNTVLGPFHIDGSPVLDQNGDMAADIAGVPTYISGTVRDTDGKPIPGVLLDIWQADEEGLYETQIPGADERLRGLLHTDASGHYGFWTIAPKGYTIPMDGPVGELIKKTDISHFRPAHVHFMISAPGHKTIVTHLFREGSPYIDTDVVFGAKKDLVVPFHEHAAGTAPDGRKLSAPYCTVDYDFVLVPEKAKADRIPA